jgi:hypothetical protein
MIIDSGCSVAYYQWMSFLSAAFQSDEFQSSQSAQGLAKVHRGFPHITPKPHTCLGDPSVSSV